MDLGSTGGIHTKNPLKPGDPEGLVTSAVNFHVQDFAACGNSFYAVLREGAESHLMQLDPVTGRWDVLTSGDTFERHPFPADGGRTIYFDMSGYARDEQQRIIARGPSAISALDTASGEIRELFADSETEYLKYTQIAEIRRVMTRPYKPRSSNANPIGCLLAPFYALSGFIHVFSSINAARKGEKPPLQVSGNEAAQQPDKPFMVDGVPIDPKQLSREQSRDKDPYPGLVPRDWTLSRVRPDGTLETLQRGVLDYFPLADGAYIYSNGAHVFHVDAAGKRRLLFKAHLAGSFALLED